MQPRLVDFLPPWTDDLQQKPPDADRVEFIRHLLLLDDGMQISHHWWHFPWPTEPEFDVPIKHACRTLSIFWLAGGIVQPMLAEEIAAAVKKIDDGLWAIEWYPDEHGWYPDRVHLYPVDEPRLEPMVWKSMYLWHEQTGNPRPATLDEYRQWLTDVAAPLSQQWAVAETVADHAGTNA